MKRFFRQFFCSHIWFLVDLGHPIVDECCKCRKRRSFYECW